LNDENSDHSTARAANDILNVFFTRQAAEQKCGDEHAERQGSAPNGIGHGFLLLTCSAMLVHADDGSTESTLPRPNMTRTPEHTAR
jgi:hypothetical protein